MLRPPPPRLRDRLERSPGLQALLIIAVIVAFLVFAEYTGWFV
jgi:hypothetical protein